MRRMAWMVFALTAAAQTADPISDRMRYEIAAAQRDYLLARQQFDLASSTLREKLGQAEKVCTSQHAVFDMVQLICKPVEEKR